MGKLSHLMPQNTDTGALSEMLLAASGKVSEIVSAVEGLSAKLQEAEERLSETVGGIAIPDHNGEIAQLREEMSTAMNAVYQHVDSVSKAVGSIRIPDPAKPTPATDLSPVIDAIAGMKFPEIEWPEAPDQKHTGEWEFDIERDQYGIRKVIAKPLRG